MDGPCTPLLDLSVKFHIFFDTLSGSCKVLCEKYLAQSHEVWRCQSLSQFLAYMKRELVSDMVGQSLGIRYREFTLRANDTNLLLFLNNKINYYLIINNLDELPPIVQSDPQCKFKIFIYSLLESLRDNKQLLSKFSEHFQFFRTRAHL